MKETVVFERGLFKVTHIEAEILADVPELFVLSFVSQQIRMTPGIFEAMCSTGMAYFDQIHERSAEG